VHYRRIDAVADSAASSTGATDATVLRMMQRARDGLGSRSSDAVKVERHMRKLSRSLAMRGANLVRNKHGQLVLAKVCECRWADAPGGGRVRVHYCSAHVIHRTKFEATDRDTGEVRTLRRYRIGYYRGGSGFVLVNDGRAAGRDLLRILSSRDEWSLTA
jgi:hypothetical protein